MPVIALIPIPSSEFGIDEKALKKYTSFPILQVFGRESIVYEQGEHIVGGLSCILDCSEEQLFEVHPDAWVTDNPMVGQWRSSPNV